MADLEYRRDFVPEKLTPSRPLGEPLFETLRDCLARANRWWIRNSSGHFATTDIYFTSRFLRAVAVVVEATGQLVGRDDSKHEEHPVSRPLALQDGEVELSDLARQARPSEALDPGQCERRGGDSWPDGC